MNRLPSEIQVMQGHAFIMDVLTRNKTPVRSIAEMEEIVVEHAELMGRPPAKSITHAKPVSAALAAKRRLGRRTWEAIGQKAAFANN